ncbi:MAG: glycosyltransferase [Saprospiraceae bacterium]|nr:glycosyltransferase [Saprospiraceae bacterium]
MNNRKEVIISGKRKRVVIVSLSLVSGGTEKITAFIANKLDKSTYEVDLILINNLNQHFRIDEHVHLINLDIKKARHAFFAICRELYRIRPDYILSTLTIVNVLMTVVKLFYIGKAKFFIRESTILSENNKHFKYKNILNFYIKYAYRRFDKIIAQSKSMADDLINNFNIPPSQIIQIYNPISRISPVINKKVDLQHPVFISIGNLRPEKGYDRMLRILSNYKGSFTYYILGEGNMEKPLRKMIVEYNLEGKVKLLGRIDDIDAYLYQSDVFLQGSYYEGFPNAVLEANVLGIPVVAFNSPGGTPEIIVDGLNGFLVENNNDAMFLKKLDEALIMNWDRNKIREYITDQFSENEIVSKYQALLR